MTIHQHHKVEAGILLREFKASGFDCWRLFDIPAFAAALNLYGECRMTRDGLFEVAHMLIIFDPNLKRTTRKVAMVTKKKQAVKKLVDALTQAEELLIDSFVDYLNEEDGSDVRFNHICDFLESCVAASKALVELNKKG